MQILEGYRNLEKIYESNTSIVYRGFDEENKRSVILKKINRKYPTNEEIQKLNREFELTSRFSFEGVIKANKLLKIDDSPIIIMEDIGGKSLSDSLESVKLHPVKFLNIGIRIAEIINNIHCQCIIHKDINPSNIIWNNEKDIIKIIDFGIATELPREIKSVKNPNVLEGTLEYISPEQTGRMNRSLDYRTDFYSLGITFYWMLTGYLPFNTKEPLKLVHSHIAILPDSPYKIDESIPKAISDIVMKLMAKNAEERYQSIYGLKADMEHCQHELDNKGVIGTFKPGLLDVSNKFEISQKIYGREKEIETLLSSFERVRNDKTELMLVSGFSGIGKSVLINEIQKPIVQYNGYFISGKFEKLKKNVPYSGIIQAFNGLMEQILAEGDDIINKWKERILTVLGVNGKIITDIIPSLELIIGKQPEVASLGSIETRNRYGLLFEEFIRTLASREHPLVIFLDDLQWADLASLTLLKLCSTDSEIKHLLIIGAYRHNEVPESHPLQLTIDTIKKTGAIVNRIFLQSLNSSHISRLLGDTLNHPVEETKSLAELLIQKTGGNPFFTNEFLKSIYKEGLIEFSHEKGWSWNTRKIEMMQATDNVVDLMTEKISGLPKNSQDILKLGACIGIYFNFTTMLTVCGKSEKATQSALRIVIQEGMLNIIDDYYSFSHDRVQEAAYSLIPDKEKIKHHYYIGNLAQKNSEKDLSDNIFYIVNQLNAGIDLITDKSEKQNLSKLNLIAGKKALASNAYMSALKYLILGIDLLNENSWKENYSFSLELYQEATIAAQQSADYGAMEKLAEKVFQNAKTILDKIRVYEIKIYACQAQNQLIEGIRIGLVVLRQLGLRLPEKPGQLRLIYELLMLKLTLAGKPVKNLINLPKMKNPHKLAIMQILSSIASTVYYATPDLLPLVIFKSIKLSVKYGNSIYSSYFYSGFGMIQCGVFRNMNTGKEYGELALNLVDKFNIKETKSKVWKVVWAYVIPWKSSIRNSIKHCLEACQIGQETGDLEFAAGSAFIYSCFLFISGFPLSNVEKECGKYIKIIKRLNQDTYLNYQLLHHQVVQDLQEITGKPCNLTGSAYDVNKMLPIHEKANDGYAIFFVYFFKLYLNYLFGNINEALKYAELIKPYAEEQIAHPYVAIIVFYDSLSRLALYSREEKIDRRKILKIVYNNQKQLKKWAYFAPMNYCNKYHLVEAEIARVLGQEVKAKKNYKLAIKLAHENRFLQEEALSMELYGKFRLELNDLNIAGLFITKAYHTNQMWGAFAKVNQIKNQYADLLADFHCISYQSSDISDLEKESTQILDLASLMKASTILSGEIVLDRLLKKMMGIVMENAGADKGIFILKQGENWNIEAEGTANMENFRILNSLPLCNINDKEILPKSIINYVIHSNTSLVLEDAIERGNFINDPYIMENYVKSILCMPLIHKGNINAILYLENNSLSNAFTSDRIEILKMLSSQMAVSIENTTMYSHLEDLVENRTQELRIKNELITRKNEDILDSIRYAQRIQRSMLPDPEIIKSYLSDSFFLWQPKDIVGGDAYYLEPVKNGFYIALFDCTGHGVPGAMMSMVATVFLRRIIIDYKSAGPAQILKQLNIIIKHFLKQNKKETLSDDGLDAAICFINPEERKLVYAGARLSIYYSKKGEIIRLKGNKQSIGYKKSKDDFDFTEHEIQIQNDSTFYMTTDGYIDQIGGNKNLPFGWKRLIRLLGNNQNKSLEKQCESLKSSLKEYIGEENPQVDDVTVVGFKI